MLKPEGQPGDALLKGILQDVSRRYQLPSIAASAPLKPDADAAALLAQTIEQARLALASDKRPDAALESVFTLALAQLIGQAMRKDAGDPAFQATLLRQRSHSVREYAALTAQEKSDARRVRSAVNAIAHPARLQRSPAGKQRNALAELQAAMVSASWLWVFDTAGRIAQQSGVMNEPALMGKLADLLESTALQRLKRLQALESDEQVREYQALWARNGPRVGSDEAAAQGSASQRRGAAVEERAALAVERLAQRLNQADRNASARARYRMVSSLHVPASLPASREYAKSEWDVVLLRRTEASLDGHEAQAPHHAVLREAQAPDRAVSQEADVWQVCLLVEAKASVDAAAIDLPRLLRGLRLLAHADAGKTYSFEAKQGTVRLSGASLKALTAEAPGLAATVLYCSDAPLEGKPRLLSAASRMQLLSAPASLQFADALAQGREPDAATLAPVWEALLESPRWDSVLHQYAALRQARALMVHVDDLMAAAAGR